jgi:hypothetical protein
MTEQTTAVYEPPVLVELGEFSEDTLGITGQNTDGQWYQAS